jgi:hypothetical protein
MHGPCLAGSPRFRGDGAANVADRDIQAPVTADPNPGVRRIAQRCRLTRTPRTMRTAVGPPSRRSLAQLHRQPARARLDPPALPAWIQPGRHPSKPTSTVRMLRDQAAINTEGIADQAGGTLRVILARVVVAEPDRFAEYHHQRVDRGGGQIATLGHGRHAPPKKPQDLTSHCCINLRLSGGVYAWEFEKSGRALRLVCRIR